MCVLRMRFCICFLLFNIVSVRLLGGLEFLLLLCSIPLFDGIMHLLSLLMDI